MTRMNDVQNTQILKLTSPIPVSVNHYLKPRAFVTWKGKTPVANVTMYETAEAKKYKRDFILYIKEQAKKQGWIKSDNKFQKYYLDAIFYFSRIDCDCNNYWKLLADSISESECVWIDDIQLCERVQGIFYDSKNPRIEMIIRPVSYIGVFKDTSQLEKFESNCIECTRYKRNCSLLRNAKEGRIQEEVQSINNEMCCSKYKGTKSK